MEFQYPSLALYLQEPQHVDYSRLLTLFNIWSRDSNSPWNGYHVVNYQYTTVGLILMGRDHYLNVNHQDKTPMVLYNRRRRMAGTAEDRLQEALGQLAVFAKALVTQEIAPGIHVDSSRLFIAFNDVQDVPNTEATLDALQPVLKNVFATAGMDTGFTCSKRANDARFEAEITFKTAPNLIDFGHKVA